MDSTFSLDYWLANRPLQWTIRLFQFLKVIRDTWFVISNLSTFFDLQKYFQTIKLLIYTFMFLNILFQNTDGKISGKN